MARRMHAMHHARLSAQLAKLDVGDPFQALPANSRRETTNTHTR